MAPGLVAAEYGLGALTAAQILLSWSHAGRIRTEAAFAMLSGTAPVPVSSGRTDRHRLNRLGDRQLNRALHIIAVSRMRSHPPTLAYVQRRRAEGKTDREIRRCIKRYLARHLYRTLSQPAQPGSSDDLTNIGASDRTVSHGASGELTVTGEHALTWAAAVRRTTSRSLPSWSRGFDSLRPLPASTVGQGRCPHPQPDHLSVVAPTGAACSRLPSARSSQGHPLAT